MTNLRIFVAYLGGLALFYVASAVITSVWQSHTQTYVWSSVGQSERLLYRTVAALVASAAFAVVTYFSGVAVPTKVAAFLGLVTGPAAFFIVLLLGIILASAGPAIPSPSLVRWLALLCHALAGGAVGLLAHSGLARLRIP